MMELVFIEGVSGVGKSTMVRMLAEELRARGYTIRAYPEFDYTNPIDFYCTACMPDGEYASLFRQYPAEADAIRANTIPAGNMRLVRYFDEDTPLFSEPLLQKMRQWEFCWHPPRPVPLAEYTAIYREVWRNFAASADSSFDFILFDGSLLHHPINDMMRNYGITGEQAVLHVQTLLDALGEIPRRIFYLQTKNIGAQLCRAHHDRGQKPPTEGEIAFWEARYRNDMTVLAAVRETLARFDVSDEGWNAAQERILRLLYGEGECV